jgi:Phycobilisome protein
VSEIKSNQSVELAQQWASKYVRNLQVNNTSQEKSANLTLSEIVSPSRREKTAQEILLSLRAISAKAWNKTELLLSEEVKQHGIDHNVINPWEIAADSFKIYQKALDVYSQRSSSRPLSLLMKFDQREHSHYNQESEVYTDQVAPEKLAIFIGADIGAIRYKYTSIDPRLIGFVSMQFHYTSEMLIEQLEPVEKILIGGYFKVIDDHLYMPLQRAYNAAANHDYNSPVISILHTLLPNSTQIAHNVRQKIIELFPNYHSMSGLLSDPIIKASSIRDVEMFQVYLWVCTLEGNISAIQEELFPLCVMLYPTLKVQWDLIRQMLYLLRYEIFDRLTPEQSKVLMPYFEALSQMFSSQVLA